MANTVRVYIEDTATALATYTSFRLYRYTAPDSSSGTLVSTTTIVAGTENYSVTDSSGTTRSWYRITYYHATGPVESDPGPAFQTVGITLRDLRIEAAQRAGTGFKGTATGGTTTTLVDSTLPDQGVDTDFLEGAWIYRPDAAAAGDKVRRVARAGFNTSTGALTVRTYTNAPVASEEYHVFALMPPIAQAGVAYNWDLAVRRGLEQLTFVDQVDLGPGDSETFDFSLVNHIGYVYPRNVRRILRRTTDSNGNVSDQNLKRNGYDWQWSENGPESLSFRLNSAPTDTETIIVEANCIDSELYIDADATRAPVEDAILSIVAEAFAMMDALEPGRYQGELAHARAAFARRRWTTAPSPVLELV